ncbi:MAG: BspA family leucine-rich repeat surface protein [Candidatus Mucispirillum faecigallinarum]|nr:BspA family leucine-rich repeat surface protein [Candidatus Mucispirillum faecigallinarum]
MDIVILIVFAAFAAGIAAVILKIVFIFFKELEKNKVDKNQENHNETSTNIDSDSQRKTAESNNITADNNIVKDDTVAADSNVIIDSNIVTDSNITADSNIKESSDTEIINNTETGSSTEEINNKQSEDSTKNSNYKVNHQVSIKDIYPEDVYLNVDEIILINENELTKKTYDKYNMNDDIVDKYYLGNKKIEENREKLFNKIKDKYYASSYSKRDLYLNRVNGKYAPKNRYELNILLNNEKVTLDEIDISYLSNLDNVFKNSKRQNYKGIEQWDTSKIVSMKNMFLNAEYFNEDISSWKVDKVKNMQSMFEGAVNFNQNLSKWNVLLNADINNMFKNTPLSSNPPWWVMECFKYQNNQAFYNFQKLFIIFILFIYNGFVFYTKTAFLY